jgi:glycosyltransferase involved in cell wall biosynthesis
MQRNNIVSAVIPTRNRAHLVLRAVRSALAQTYADLEVIVIIDGPDHETETALQEVHDPRLRVIALSSAVGAGQSRNLAVQAAHGDWIAFLDDDDEWLPEKIDLQMSRAINSPFHFPIVSSQLLARTSAYEVVWPRTQPSEPLSEYLLARNGWSYGDGLLSTITLLFPRELFDHVRFRSELQRHQDWDWLLRAVEMDGAGIEFIQRPLAIWHQAERRASISTAADWRVSFDWAEDSRQMITPRAYASFLATQVAPQAARQKDWRAFPFLFRKMFTRGAPNARDIALYLAMWSMPMGIRLSVRKANR